MDKICSWGNTCLNITPKKTYKKGYTRIRREAQKGTIKKLYYMKAYLSFSQIEVQFKEIHLVFNKAF